MKRKTVRQYARNIADHLRSLFPSEQYRILPRALEDPARALESNDQETPILFAPRIWAELPDDVREDPRAFEIKYVFPDDELESIATHFDWPVKNHEGMRTADHACCPASTD